MVKLLGYLGLIGSCAMVGCGGDSETSATSTGTAGTVASGSGGSAGASAGGGSQGGSQNAAGSTNGGVDGSADDGGPYSLPNLDAMCGGGPTGNQLMAFVHVPYSGTFSPPKRAAMYPWNGPTAVSALSVGVEYKGGTILCTIDHYMCPGGGVPCRVQNPPTISVDLAVSFKTADGVLDESFVATANYASNIRNVNFQADLPASKIAGTYPIVTGTKDQVKLVFGGQFEGLGYNGNISEIGQGTSIPGGSWMETSTAADASTDH